MFDFSAKKDEEYLALLKIAKVSDNLSYSPSQLASIVDTLNCLHKYKVLHKRIIPLLNDKAKKLNVFHLLNNDIQKLLDVETQKGVVTTLAQKCQLTKIVTALSTENISIILLKGSAFMGSLYKESAPRTSNDIDILIKQKDWEHALKVISTIMVPLPIKHKQVFDNLYETSFIPKEKIGGTVDIHKSLVHPYLFNINENELWEESIEHVAYNSNLVRTLSAEHALIHQALHGYKDMDFSKYNLIDTYEIVKQFSPDLFKTIETAKRWGATTPVYVLLMCCTKIMPVEFDKAMLRRIKPATYRTYIIAKLLNSSFSYHLDKRKPFQIRLNQVLAQFVFTANIQRPLVLQLLFIKKIIGRTSVKIK